MKTVIVSGEIVGLSKNGGIATFVNHFSKLLKAEGHEVTIIYTGDMPELPVKSNWKAMYKQQGIKVIPAKESPPAVKAIRYEWFVRRSEAVASKIPKDTDVVYFPDWQASNFSFVRARRFDPDSGPVCVTVMHSSTPWLREANEWLPYWGYADMAFDFGERYGVQYSDFAVSPSRYMLEWARSDGWIFPPAERVRVLGLPILPSTPVQSPPKKPARHFRRIVFFGRLEKRKGIELFIEGLLALADEQPKCLETIEEVVFLGKDANHRFGSVENMVTLLKDIGLKATPLIDLDSVPAQRYLTENACDSLVVMPSLTETMGYTVIEASLIPGLNFICSNAGGIPEVLGEVGEKQLFQPFLRPFVNKLSEWLMRGPVDSGTLGHYDAQAANQRWMEFHREVCEFAEERKKAAKRKILAAPNTHLLDVCIPYYNHGKYLPQLLAALERQTVQGFNVYVVNDGSTDPDSIAAFEAMKRKYEGRGWQFVSQANAYLGATRNNAAALGKGEYIVFVDADNVPAPHMVERFLESILTSGDDCLTCYMYAFEGDGLPYDVRSGAITALPAYVYTPLGNCPEGGLLENVFGDANCIIKRKSFEALGGFTTDRFLCGEDYELFSRLSLEGYKLDVIPEYLFYYRHLPDSMLRATSTYRNKMRALRGYKESLKKAKLQYLVPAIFGMYQHLNEQLYREQPPTPPPPDARWLAEHISWNKLLLGLGVQLAYYGPRKLYRTIIPLPIRLGFRDLRWKLRGKKAGVGGPKL